jgi:NADPH:quinone reductase-like Zn-dependent oxidoreductase
MKYVEASKFGGPEVLKVIEKEIPRLAEGMLLVEVQALGSTSPKVKADQRDVLGNVLLLLIQQRIKGSRADPISILG